MSVKSILIENANVINIYFLIIVSVLSAVVKKIYPYLKTKINIYTFKNLDMAFNLLKYEFGGTLFGILAGIICPIFFGEKSTVKYIFFTEYLMASMIAFIIYLTGIIYIIKKMRKKSDCKYFINLFYASLIFLPMLIYLGLSFLVDEYKKFLGIAYMLIGLSSLFQALENIEIIKVRRITYMIYTKNKTYMTVKKPVSKGNSTVIKIIDKKGKIKELIEIPSSAVLMIKHIIDNQEIKE